jgi:hypothetical protein
MESRALINYTIDYLKRQLAPAKKLAHHGFNDNETVTIKIEAAEAILKILEGIE